MTYWRTLMGLNDWHGRVVFKDVSDLDEQADGRVYMDIDVLWPYKRYAMNVAVGYTATIDEHDLDELIIHELSHVLIEPLAERFNGTLQLDRDLVESVSTNSLIASSGAARWAKE